MVGSIVMWISGGNMMRRLPIFSIVCFLIVGFLVWWGSSSADIVMVIQPVSGGVGPSIVYDNASSDSQKRCASRCRSFKGEY